MTDSHSPVSRRSLLTRAGGGFGLLALADLLHRDGLLGSQALAAAPANALAVRDPHFPARAKSVWRFCGRPTRIGPGKDTSSGWSVKWAARTP